MKTVPAPVAGVSYIHTDGLGSPVAKSDANGNLIATSRTRYEPYGMAVAGTATPTIGFTGYVNDADTGLTYMQQRYYDPVAGRFLSTDPVLTDENSAAHFNRYVYAENNPYKYIDPDGWLVFLAPMAWGAAIGGGINLTAQLVRSGGDWSRVNVKQVLVAAGAGALSGGAGAISSTAVTTTGMVGANVVSGAAISAVGAHVSAAVDGNKASTSDVLSATWKGGAASGLAGAATGVPSLAQTSAIPGTATKVGAANIIEGIRTTTSSTGKPLSYAAPAGQAVANRVGDIASNSTNVEQQPKDKK
ncbi:RHS repeat-associated core domain-containing protein [Undibacterium sp. LX15W]|uniref:RHS repeat-associated core domain-containing protein n=2 Tax=Undibacterium flavidum TaxID=2762297 RepID=A0ABR6YEA8_9BURK|nr:RHS repeat-associated core domain-containing protein [Undibacterium flavidum]